MNLFELFERFVVAHEKQADAAMLMAQNRSGGCVCKDKNAEAALEHAALAQQAAKLTQSDGTECTAGQQQPGPEEESKTLPDWNPLTETIQGRYGKDKVQILDKALTLAGINLKASASGAEKHQALLDAAKPKTAEEAVEEQPAQEEATSPATVDDVRALAQKAMSAGITAAVVQDIFEQTGGTRRLPEIPEEKIQAVYEALKARVELGV